MDMDGFSLNDEIMDFNVILCIILTVFFHVCWNCCHVQFFLPPKDMAVRVKVKPVKSSKVTVEKERAGPYLKMNCSAMIQSWPSFWYAYSTVSAPSVWTLFVPNIGYTQRGNTRLESM